MSFTTETHSTRFFSVVGAAYVAESHSEMCGYLAARPQTRQVDAAVAGLWASFFAVIGFSLMQAAPAAKAMQVASAALH